MTGGSVPVPRTRGGVPWFTVLLLAAPLAYADGFWVISLRGAVGAIERAQEPFATWLRESTLLLPVFVLAVLGALTLARRWFGPVLRRDRAVVATALLIVVAGTLTGISELAASSAYDYWLQSRQLQSTGGMAAMTCTAGCLTAQQHATQLLQVRAVAYGSGILLVTNLLLVGWAVALLGGRLDVSGTRRRLGRVVRSAQNAPKGSVAHPRTAVRARSGRPRASRHIRPSPPGSPSSGTRQRRRAPTTSGGRSPPSRPTSCAPQDLGQLPDAGTVRAHVGQAVVVELAGIEPASSSVEPGLLRVQSVLSFSRPRRSHEHVADRPSQV